MLMRCSGNCLFMPLQKQVVAAEVMVDAALLLLFHPVHDGGSVVNLADLV